MDGLQVMVGGRTGGVAAGNPSVNVSLYTTVSLGGYGEALLIGNLILIVALRIGNKLELPGRLSASLDWLALGFLTGFGLWVFGMTLVYSLPAFAYLAWRWRQARASRYISQTKFIQGAAIILLGCVLVRSWLMYALGYGFKNLISSWG
jgi:hypothetical protein